MGFVWSNIRTHKGVGLNLLISPLSHCGEVIIIFQNLQQYIRLIGVDKLVFFVAYLIDWFFVLTGLLDILLEQSKGENVIILKLSLDAASIVLSLQNFVTLSLSSLYKAGICNLPYSPRPSPHAIYLSGPGLHLAGDSFPVGWS